MLLLLTQNNNGTEFVFGPSRDLKRTKDEEKVSVFEMAEKVRGVVSWLILFLWSSIRFVLKNTYHISPTAAYCRRVLRIVSPSENNPCRMSQKHLCHSRQTKLRIHNE